VRWGVYAGSCPAIASRTGRRASCRRCSRTVVARRGRMTARDRSSWSGARRRAQRHPPRERRSRGSRGACCRWDSLAQRCWASVESRGSGRGPPGRRPAGVRHGGESGRSAGHFFRTRGSLFAPVSPVAPAAPGANPTAGARKGAGSTPPGEGTRAGWRAGEARATGPRGAPPGPARPRGAAGRRGLGPARAGRHLRQERRAGRQRLHSPGRVTRPRAPAARGRAARIRGRRCRRCT
jgi:hypothetical protein